MGFATKTYTKEDLRSFKLKDVYGLTQTLISAYSRLHQGSNKEIDLVWVKKTLKQVMGIAENIVDDNIKSEEKRKEKEREEEGKVPPFKSEQRGIVFKAK